MAKGNSTGKLTEQKWHGMEGMRQKRKARGYVKGGKQKIRDRRKRDGGNGGTIRTGKNDMVSEEMRWERKRVVTRGT